MADPLRVLRVLTRPNLGGPARQCVALGRVLPRLGVETLCATGTAGNGETELVLPATGFVRVPGLGAGIDPASDIESFSALLRLARAHGPQVVHTHTAKAGLIGALVARRLGVPVVHTFHGHVLRDYFPAPVARLLCWLERRLARRRAAVFCVSRSCGRELEALGVVRRGGWDLVPPALDLAARNGHGASVRARLGLDEDALAIAWCGRLVPVKDPGLLVRTADRLAASGRTVTVCAFGSGPLAPLLAPTRVRWLGPRPDFPSLLPAFDVLLMTSRREGLPLAAVEALAAGVPVVGPRVPGLVDLAGPGVVLCDRAPEPLARACLDAPPVPAGRSRDLRARHDPGSVARSYVRVYARLTTL